MTIHVIVNYKLYRHNASVGYKNPAKPKTGWHENEFRAAVVVGPCGGHEKREPEIILWLPQGNFEVYASTGVSATCFS